MDIIEKFSRFYTDLASMKIDELEHIYEKNVVFTDPISSHSGIETVKAYFSRLLANAKHCEFVIHNKFRASEENAVINWTMTYTSKRLNGGEPINVDGITLLQIEGDKIVMHRDYFDLGQMVYENVPLLGRFVKGIKRKMG